MRYLGVLLIGSLVAALALGAGSTGEIIVSRSSHVRAGVEPSPFDVQPGSDYWSTPDARIVFGTPDLPPLPADFFHPGSLPFEGEIKLRGIPIDPPSLGPTDTIVQRDALAPLSTNGTAASIPIEIVQLQLQSVQPIVVQPEGTLWQVFIQLPPSRPASGIMTILRVDEQGGQFDWDAFLEPDYVFVPLAGGPPVFLTPPPPLFVNNEAPGVWSYTPPEPPPPGAGPNFLPILKMDMELPGSFEQTIYPIWAQACCLPDGTCQFGPASICLQQGGEPQGVGSFCSGDLDGDGIDDTCLRDCNSNGIDDRIELAAGSAQDANANGIPDECDIAECRSNDLNHNGITDESDIAAGTATDANTNGLIDEVEQPANQHSYISMQGGRLRDDKLAKKLKDLLVNTNGTANAKDVKLFFQQCFGGGMLDDIARELGKSVPWVGGSASRHDEVSFGEGDSNVDSNGPMDRWTRPLVGALADLPVLRALKKAARDDVANPLNRVGQNERPQYRFSGDDARGITLEDPEASSHHAVLLAGKPDGQRHRNDIRKMCELLKAEWGNLDTNGTSVHVLFGDGTDNPCSGSGVPGGNVSAATTAGFCVVLDNLRPLMNANEEFVFYVSDHGTGSVAAVNADRFRGVGDVFGFDLDVPQGYWYGLIRDPFNDGPTFKIHATGAYAPGTVEVFFNGQSIGFLDPASINPDGQNVTTLPVREGAVQIGPNTLEIDATAAGGGVAIVSAEFQLNDISTIPAPGWGDADGDGDVDHEDHIAFVACLSGPDGGYLNPDCANVDIDGDGDVDLVDFQLFQSVFTGQL
jgi:hypothetical protein